MDIKYSFLKDELALIEIRKHKWIESEKQGREIGFATAALDWIKKYGAAWKQFRVPAASPHFIFSEKRLHRRFSIQFPIQVSSRSTRFKSTTNDISLVGLSCTLPESLPMDAPADVTLLLQDNKKILSRLQFQSRVVRVSQPQNRNGYNVFLPFNEETRDCLRINAEILGN